LRASGESPAFISATRQMLRKLSMTPLYLCEVVHRANNKGGRNVFCLIRLR
jgi:hypothetical protein